MIVRKTRAELEKMRQSGLLVWNILQKLGSMAVEGVSKLELEIAAEKMISDAGAKPTTWTSLHCELQRDWNRSKTVPGFVQTFG